MTTFTIINSSFASFTISITPCTNSINWYIEIGRAIINTQIIIKIFSRLATSTKSCISRTSQATLTIFASVSNSNSATWTSLHTLRFSYKISPCTSCACIYRCIACRTLIRALLTNSVYICSSFWAFSVYTLLLI